ncbi:hypothetical protein ACFQT0_23190 [Hymenobacter humi]|uniref:Uncharacterized protein n=1 Tax=Hymenobacter humi TaxID=1411620 RepID=A0ABW2UAU2_9BACT
MKEPNKHIGAGMNRVDGRLKVTGAATYSAEYQPAQHELRRARGQHHCQGPHQKH